MIIVCFLIMKEIYLSDQEVTSVQEHLFTYILILLSFALIFY